MLLVGAVASFERPVGPPCCPDARTDSWRVEGLSRGRETPGARNSPASPAGRLEAGLAQTSQTAPYRGNIAIAARPLTPGAKLFLCLTQRHSALTACSGEYQIAEAHQAIQHLLLTRFLVLTGWRRGEAIGLRWDQLDLIRRTAVLSDTKTALPSFLNSSSSSRRSRFSSANRATPCTGLSVRIRCRTA